MGHFVDHVNRGRHQVLFAVCANRQGGFAHLHTAQLLQKIEVKVSAAELAIGNGLKAHVFLEFDNLGDGLVFHQAQLLGGDRSFGFLLTGIQQKFGAQKAAHMVITGG